VQGLAGELIFDGDAAGLNFSTLNKAQDAKVILGNGLQSGVLITSSSNTIANSIPGLTLTLNGVSEKPVTVNVTENQQSAADAMKELIDAINVALGRLDEASKYDPETETAGPLLGESEVYLVRSRLIKLATAKIPGASGSIKRLTDLGVSIKDGQLTFDEKKFLDKLKSDPQAVIEFFTAEETGAAEWVKKEVEFLTGEKGPLERRDDAFESQRTDLIRRVDRLNELLDLKRQRLMRQYLAMEQSLAQLQSQQNSLGQLATLASQFSVGSAGK
jgi:flagellar hook-associated protein 2